MLKRWTLVFAVVFLSLSMAGCISLLRPTPGAVEGVVVDYEDKPLAGATVSIEGKDDLVTVTGANGAFRFTQIPSGPVVLEVDHPDYRKTKTPVFVPNGRSVQTIILAGADIWEGFEHGLGSFVPQNATRVPAQQSDEVALAGNYSMKTFPGTWEMYKFATPMAGRLVLYFYDDMDQTPNIAKVVEVKVSGGKYSDTASHLVGIATHATAGDAGKSGNYIGRHWWYGHGKWLWVDTGIPRSLGWHRVEYVVQPGKTEVFLDNTKIYETQFGDTILDVFIGNPWPNDAGGVGWWDQFVFVQADGE